MKKLITLLLVLTGIVSTASAVDHYIVTGHANIVNGNTEWSGDEVANYMTSSGTKQYYLVVEGCSLTKDTKYEFKILPDGNWSLTYPSNNYEFQVDKTGTYTLIYTFYYNSDEDYTVNVVPVLNLTLSNNYNGADIWDTYNSSAVFTHTSGTYKWTLDIPACSTTTGDWSFRIFKDGLLKWNADAGKNKIRPNTSDNPLTVGGDADASTWIGTETRSWKVPYLSYGYDHYTITAEYNVAERYANNWKVSVDAYISKILNASYTCATLGAGAKLDLSGLSGEGVTAYPLTANVSTGKITKGSAFSGTLAANTGVLLEYELDTNKTIDIPVSAADASSISNDLVACTSGHINQTNGDGYTNYILAAQNNHVGFYMVNETHGNDMGDYTAYLHVENTADTDAAGEGNARAFFGFDDNATAIDAVKQEQKMNGEYFNLAGQRIAQPTKGLYIANGKKVIIK